MEVYRRIYSSLLQIFIIFLAFLKKRTTCFYLPILSVAYDVIFSVAYRVFLNLFVEYASHSPIIKYSFESSLYLFDSHF